MIIGFTGTRKGMTPSQIAQLRIVLTVFVPDPESARGSQWDFGGFEFHHGGAVGADREAHSEASIYCGEASVHVHPCPGVIREDGPKFTFGSKFAVWHEVFSPLVRNRHIVEACGILIAAPETDTEQLRSGTWTTVRYARKAGKPVVMLSR